MKFISKSEIEVLFIASSFLRFESSIILLISGIFAIFSFAIIAFLGFLDSFCGFLVDSYQKVW